MKRPRQLDWMHCIVIIIVLAAAISAVAGWLIHIRTAQSVAVTLRHRTAAASGFAEAAETWISAEAEEAWISLDARQSFHRIVELMLLDTATYAQVVLNQAVIVSAIDSSWAHAIPLPPSVTPVGESNAVLQSIEGRLLCDVTIPIGTQTPEDPYGIASYTRVGYDLAVLSGHLLTIRLAGAGIAVAAFFLVCLCGACFLAWLDHRGVLTSPLAGAIQSLSVSSRHCAPLSLDEHAKQVTLHGEPLFLPPKPFDLLCLLVQEGGRVLKEDEIIGTLWPNADLADSRDIRQCVYLLRKRLDAAAAGASACVQNVKGFGYRFDEAALRGLVPPCDPEPAAST